MDSKITNIIYECDHSGHRLEYIGHLINGIRKDNSNNEYLFIVTIDLFNALNNNGYDIRNINFNILDNVYKTSKIRAIYLQKDLQSIIDGFPNLKNLVLLNFDLFQYSLIFFNIPKKVQIKSIWFRPFHRFESKNLKDRAATIFKTILLNLISIRHGSRLSLYILNDLEGTKILNRKIIFRPINLFRFLSDPIDDTIRINEDKTILKSKFGFNNGCYLFIILGTIDKKKNVENTLMAIKELRLDKNVEVLIAGKIAVSYKEEFANFIMKYKSINYQNVKVRFDDRFISTGEFHEYLFISDAILMIYRDFYSSSGIFAHAALYRKPVVTSNMGLMKILVEKYKIGQFANPNNIKDIANKINEAITTPSSQQGFERYLIDNSVSSFCKQLLY